MNLAHPAASASVPRLQWHAELSPHLPGRSQYTTTWDAYQCTIVPLAPRPATKRPHRVRLMVFKADPAAPTRPELIAEGRHAYVDAAKQRARHCILDDLRRPIPVGPAQALRLRSTARKLDSHLDWYLLPSGPPDAWKRNYFHDEDPRLDRFVTRIDATVEQVSAADRRTAAIAREGAWRYEVWVRYWAGGQELEGALPGGLSDNAVHAKGAATAAAHQFELQPDERLLHWVSPVHGTVEERHGRLH